MLEPGTQWRTVSTRLAAIAALSFVFPAAAFANCVLQPDGVTAVCDTSAPNPFPSSVNANPTTGGTVTIPTTGASVMIQPGAGISSPGAAVQVRNNSIVTNDGSVSTSLINVYGIWAGDPSNSTSSTAGFATRCKTTEESSRRAPMQSACLRGPSIGHSATRSSTMERSPRPEP
jgi:hypothetical protein